MSALHAVDPELRPRLSELAETINAEHAQVWRAGRKALEHAVRCGEALLEAQRQVQHGSWLKWMHESVSVHPTSAYKYMRLARYSEKVLSEATGVENALALVASEPWANRRRTSERERSEMVAMAEEQGLTLDEIAEAFGVARSTVWRYVSAKSAAQREAFAGELPSGPFADWLRHKIRSYGSLEALASVCGLSDRRIRNVLSEQTYVTLALVDRVLTVEGSTRLAELYPPEDEASGRHACPMCGGTGFVSADRAADA